MVKYEKSEDTRLHLVYATSRKYTFLFLFLQKLQLGRFSAALLHLRGRVA
jgi:hypothetical protein